MFENTNTDHVWRACAPIKCARADKCPRNQEVSFDTRWQARYAGNRKTLGL
jgi:hypothetical protein